MRLDQKEKINRLVIYFFYDADGIVDRYIPYMLEDINKNCSELFVVCNGNLTPEGRATFKKLTPHLLVRENKGFDVWAYKAALEYYGWEKLEQFDEVIMMNHTIMGPVYPFSEMFAEMDKRDLDFWRITKYPKVGVDPFGTISYGYIPEHIQSHFIAVRNNMLKSMEFRDYWDNRPEITCYADAVGKHEAIFTKSFGDKGFRWAVYVDTTDREKFEIDFILTSPVALIEKYRCPIFKRRSFFHDYYYILHTSTGEQTRQLMAYLREKTNYDVGMIWENILRTCNMADVKTALCLDYILPKSGESKPGTEKVALVIHSYFEDLVQYCYDYALSMPESSDIYITTDSEKKEKEIKKVFANGPWNSVKVIRIENRGRDVSALLVGVAEYLPQYDLVCFMHDKKVGQLDYGIKGYSFSERCYQNLLGSKCLVNHIIALFRDEPFLGLLVPPVPNHAEYYPTLGLEWGLNFDATKKLADQLELNVPMSNSKEPIAPLGTMFWFRPKALKKILDYGWEYKDFPEEPNAADGTVLHAIERVYPFVAQDAGYYSAWVLSDEYARQEINNLTYMLRTLNESLFPIYGGPNHWELKYRITSGHNPDVAEVEKRIVCKRKIKKWVPKPIWNGLKKIYHLFGGKKWVG